MATVLDPPAPVNGPAAEADPRPDAGAGAADTPGVVSEADAGPADPFPEPPAGLPYWTATPLKLSIYRTAWPHLDAAQRAEVARLMDTDVRSARQREADEA